MSSDGPDFVVVPHRPGALVPLTTHRQPRGRDDLDELIDDLLPDVDEGPGWVDAVLVVVGVGLLLWALIGDAPVIVAVVGVAALVLGCILPARAAWRRAGQRRQRRHRQALLAAGVAIDVSSPAAAALVEAYDALAGLAHQAEPELGDAAIAAAHDALLEVASLLKGRSPTTAREVAYVEQRTGAVVELAGALRELPAGRGATGGDASDVDGVTLDPDALVAAREELDEISPLNSITRLEHLIAEARIQRRDRS